MNFHPGRLIDHVEAADHGPAKRSAASVAVTTVE